MRARCEARTAQDDLRIGPSRFKPPQPPPSFENEHDFDHSPPLLLQVAGLRGIVTEPSRLESTGLVFAYGLDLFYTRVMPSKMYDTLDAHEFSYALLVLTLLSLAVGTAVAGRAVARKELAEKWK